MDSKKIVDAILNKVLFSYEFDVTTGLIEEDIIGNDGINYTKMMGFSAPCFFDDFVKSSAIDDLKVSSGISENSSIKISRDILLNVFASGGRKYENIIYSEDNKKFFRASYYLWMDATDRHVKALSICEDLTDYVQGNYHKELREARHEAEEANNRTMQILAVINGLSNEYHTIWLVDKETRRKRLVRSAGSNTTSQALYVGLNSPIYGEGIEYYIRHHVDSMDQERFRQGFDFDYVVKKLEHESSFSINYLRHDAYDRVSYHQITFANADSDDGRRQFVYAFRDIDKIIKEEEKLRMELKEAKEEAEKANNAKTNFLFNMSHDIRTPLNAILSYSHLIKKELDDPKLLHYQEKMEQASGFLLTLVNNVLDMARIESGKMELDEEYSYAGDVVANILNVYESQARERNIHFKHSVEVEHDHILCDKLKIQEIFSNLISNAIKYNTDGGSVSVITRELPCRKEGYIVLETVVEDTGIGISKEFLPHIFDSFSRERNTTHGKIAGSGLGMPIVKKYVELMGGHIFVESQLGKGTRITVTLPHHLANESAYQMNQKEYDTSEMKEFLRGKHILLAEDNELNAEIAITILEEFGFIVDHVTDGIQCVDRIEKAQAGSYDAILMDIQMPNMDGYMATQIIRQLPTDKANIPIIAMTANAFEEDRRRALESGMNGHIAKPIEIPKMMETICLHLRREDPHFKRAES